MNDSIRLRFEDLCDRVTDLGGYDRAESATAVAGTLGALGAALLPEERRSLSEYLSPECSSMLCEEPISPRTTLAEFFQAVERRTGRNAGTAREEAQVVCAALTDLMPGEPLALLRYRLSLFAHLFERREPVEPPAPQVFHREPPIQPPAGTLATGRRTED